MARASNKAAVSAATTHSSALRSLLFPGTNRRNLLMEAKALDAALPLIAQGMVDRSGHKIRLLRQSGPGACTDGTSISLMDAIAPSSSRDEEAYILFVALKLGLLHHEMGHVNHTDFSVPRAPDSLTMYLENLFEDIRQEKVHCNTVRSGRTYIQALGMAMIDAGIDSAVDSDADPVAVFTSYLYAWLRVVVSGEGAYQSHLDTAKAAMERTFDEAFMLHVDAQLSRAADLDSTLAAMHLAEDVRALIEQEVERVQKQQSAPAAGSSGDASQGSPDGPSAQDPDAGQPGSSAGDAGDDQAGSGSGGADTSASAPDTTAQQQQLQALQDLLDGAGLDAEGGSRDGRLRQALQQVSDALQANGAATIEVNMAPLQAAIEPNRSLHVGNTVDLDKGSSATTRVRAQLRQHLFAESRTRTGRSARGTRIDPKRLHHVAFGDPRIFRTTTKGIALDTAVLLLADVSGSMHGERIDVCDQALFATACALETLPGINVAVAAFPGNQLVIPFGTRAKRERTRFTLTAHGGTPMEDGVMMANRMLQLRKEPRKLLFVLTDGEPNDANSARAALSVSRRMGIETYGLGIQTDSVQHFFADWQVINEVGDLPTALFAMLKNRLERVA